jgi:hypothetical protein
MSFKRFESSIRYKEKALVRSTRALLFTARQKLAFERDGNEKDRSFASAEQGFFFAQATHLRIMSEADNPPSATKQI